MLSLSITGANGSEVDHDGGDLPVWETARWPTELGRFLPFHATIDTNCSENQSQRFSQGEKMVHSKSNTSRQETKVPDWVPQHLFPFPSRTIEIENCRVHYVDEGSGPVLLLLHGNPTWSFLYRDIIRGLKNDFRCIALDYPGFGLSKASDGYDFKPATHARIVEKFIEALNLDGILLDGAGLGRPSWLVRSDPVSGALRWFHHRQHHGLVGSR